mgnify:CR=1 FL=1
MMVGMFDNQKDWEIAAQMGVANYGQMTAGGWMYIGPQGIVHGTFNTLLNAGRMKLGVPQNGNLNGHRFRILRIRRNEWRTTQSGRDSRSSGHHSRSRLFTHRNPPPPRVGTAYHIQICLKPTGWLPMPWPDESPAP